MFKQVVGPQICRLAALPSSYPQSHDPHRYPGCSHLRCSMPAPAERELLVPATTAISMLCGRGSCPRLDLGSFNEYVFRLFGLFAQCGLQWNKRKTKKNIKKNNQTIRRNGLILLTLLSSECRKIKKKLHCFCVGFSCLCSRSHSLT